MHPEFKQISLEGYEIAENNKRTYEDNEIKSKLFSLGNLRIMTIRSNSGKDSFQLSTVKNLIIITMNNFST